MKVLGLATMGTSAAALVDDGVVVAAVEEERLTRLKNDGGFPLMAVRECLRRGNCTLQDVDVVAVYWQPWRVLTRGAFVLRRALFSPAHAASLLRRVQALFLSEKQEDAYPELRGRWMDLFRLRRLLQREFGPFQAKIRFFDHHFTHAASVFPLSGFDEAICLTYDGGGEAHSTVISHVRDGEYRPLKKIRWPNSLGHFYSAFTGFLGFRMLEGEYKMMGLAPYGTPRFAQTILENVLCPLDDGEYRLNYNLLNYHDALQGRFSDRMVEMFGAPRKPDEEFTQHHRDLAASVQAAFEHILLHMLKWVKQQLPDVDDLCVAGGCGLNVTANGKVLREGLFDRILVPPAPHDAGCAIGAALLAANDGEMKPGSNHVMPHPYLGREFSDEDIVEAFRACGIAAPDAVSDAELLETTARTLASGGVVAWFQGGAEFGPRALGNRSFLADPRDDGIREVLNRKIKKRELFRPFAPSVKEEVAGDFFDLSQPSPYMNIVARVHPDKRNIIPAVTHVDGSARVHTVSRKANPRYWALLDAFEKITGVGVLLNTSFNIQEPIVYTPTQALRTFMRSDVDLLVMGNRIFRRE